jgi:hypothetical protein
MAENFRNRAAQFDKMGDARGAETFRRLARQCEEEIPPCSDPKS